MKKYTICLVVGFWVMSVVAFGQAGYAFKVLASKGSNEYKSGDTWQAVKTGISLKEGDEIKVADNSYIALVTGDGKPMEIKAADTYPVSELLKKVKAGSGSVMSKYTDFLLSSNSAEARKNRISATGAVHRGGVEPLEVHLPEAQNASVFNKSFVVTWATPTAGGPYVVKVKNIFEDDLAKFETSENSQRIDLNDPKFAGISAVMVEVASKSDSKVKSKGMVVKLLSNSELEKVKKAYAEIASDVSDESAISRYIQAGFFEQNGLLIDALTAYEDAIRLAPDVDTYREARDEFLYRNRLSRPKQ